MSNTLYILTQLSRDASQRHYIPHSFSNSIAAYSFEIFSEQQRLVSTSKTSRLEHFSKSVEEISTFMLLI